MTDSAGGILSMGPPSIRFAVWSDSVAAAEVLSAHLHDLHQSAVAVTGESEQQADCLVVLAHRERLSAAELAAWVRLANRASVHLAARPRTSGTPNPESWPT